MEFYCTCCAGFLAWTGLAVGSRMDFGVEALLRLLVGQKVPGSAELQEGTRSVTM